MRRRLHLAAPASREHIFATYHDQRVRLHGPDVLPDEFELALMAGEPIEVPSYSLPGEPRDYGLSVHDRVRIAADGSWTMVS